MKRNLQRLGLVLVASLAMLSCSKEGMGYDPNGGGTPTPPGLTDCNGSIRKIQIQTNRAGVQDTIYDQTTYNIPISTFTTWGYDIQCGEIKEYINQPPVGVADPGGWIITKRIIDCR